MAQNQPNRRAASAATTSHSRAQQSCPQLARPMHSHTLAHKRTHMTIRLEA